MVWEPREPGEFSRLAALALNFLVMVALNVLIFDLGGKEAGVILSFGCGWHYSQPRLSVCFEFICCICDSLRFFPD